MRIRSVAAAAFAFLTTAALFMVAAGWLLWYVADREGLVARVERFIEELGFETFEFEPDRILYVGVALAVGMVVLGTLLAVAATALLDLILHAIGGLEIVAEQGWAPAAATAASVTDRAQHADDHAGGGADGPVTGVEPGEPGEIGEGGQQAGRRWRPRRRRPQRDGDAIGGRRAARCLPGDGWPPVEEGATVDEAAATPSSVPSRAGVRSRGRLRAAPRGRAR